jgi:uncharacterized protein (TIGR04255 family)
MRFANLPLVEVACRFSYREPLPVGLTFFSDLADALRTRGFGTLNDLQRIEEVPGLVLAPEIRIGTPMPASGASYTGKPQGVSLNFQRHVVSVRWNGEGGSSQYPGFVGGILPSCQAAFEAIDSVVAGRSHPDVGNMYYVNRIPVDADFTWSEIERLLSIGTIPLAQSSMLVHGLNLNVRRKDGVDYRVEIELIDQESEQRAMVLVNTAGSGIGPNDDPLRKTESLHSVLIEEFEKMLTEEAVSRWR